MESLQGRKILFVITKSNWGGAQAYVYALATDFAKKGASVVVALGGTGLADAPLGLLHERLQEAEIRTVLVKSFMREVSTEKEFGALAELRQIIRTEKPDILHLNSSKAGGIGTLAGRLENVERIIFTAHGWAHREPRSVITKMAIRVASWATVLLSHKVIVVSQLDFQDSPVLFSRKKIVVIRNGIPEFPLMSRSEAREQLSTKNPALMPNGLWILMEAAELVKNKAVDTAIAAFNVIRHANPSAILVVLGEGEERRALEAQIHELKLQDRVFLLGFVPDSKKYLLAADIFLVTSRKEGLPLALLEAGIAKLPVVASKTGGIPEVIQDGKTGILAQVDNPQSFAKALETLLNDAEKRTELGENNSLNVRKEFSEAAMLEKTQAVYLS